MPTFVTKDFKGKELYFDMRPNGKGKKDGFWAIPLFESDREEIKRGAEATGSANRAWIELLVHCIKKWEGFVDLNGQEIPCTENNIRDLCESDSGMMMVIFNMLLDAGRNGKIIAEKN